jgi:hypothetical protein
VNNVFENLSSFSEIEFENSFWFIGFVLETITMTKRLRQCKHNKIYYYFFEITIRFIIKLRDLNAKS